LNKKALEGIKICDFTWAIAGPLITKYLADFGATVVRIEFRSAPGSIRSSPPYKDGIVDGDRSVFFAYWNPNKYDISIDMNNPAGLEIARKLVAWSDAVVENFAAGRMEQWGLEYEKLKEIKRDIIMVRSSNQGQTGPDRGHPGYGTQLSSLVGYTHLTGFPGGPPLQPWAAPTDYIAARFGVAGILSAIMNRRETGKGQYLDLSQVEANLQFLIPQMLDYTVNHHDTDRNGNACDWAAPHGVYPCRGEDRWCTITVFTDEEWTAFCTAIGRPALAADARFATLLDRKKNEAALDEVVREYTSALAPEEVMAQLQAAGVPAGVVQNSEDLFKDPQLRHRGYFWSQEHSAIGTVGAFGQAANLSKTPATMQRPSPCVGEHTQYVCSEFLHLSDEEFVEYYTAGAFGFD